MTQRQWHKDNDTNTMTMTQTQRYKHKGKHKQTLLPKTHRKMKCPNYTNQNNNKAAMRVLLIGLAALLSLELMTTAWCNYTCVNKTKKKENNRFKSRCIYKAAFLSTHLYDPWRPLFDFDKKGASEKGASETTQKSKSLPIENRIRTSSYFSVCITQMPVRCVGLVTGQPPEKSIRWKAEKTPAKG